MLPEGKHVDDIVFVAGAYLDEGGEALVAFRAVLQVDSDLFAHWELENHFLEALESVDIGEGVRKRLGWGGVVRRGGEDFCERWEWVGVVIKVGGAD